MFGGGGMVGGPMGGGGTPGSPQAGLPFGGIPYELQEGVDLLLEEEPQRGESDAVFTQLPQPSEKKKLSLTSLLTEYKGMLVLATFLVALISVSTQVGPSLVSYAINHGLTPPHYKFEVVVVCAALYLVSVGVSAGAQWGQARTTGRLASWVMNDLRIKVFRHLQRLSLDFFTEEKAGVVMSRMTSDIENLQQLLQDGLAQFAIQGLTMVVITIFLFATNATLAAITVFAVLPPLVIMSIWFKRASERGYDKVRDGIALVLADLSESLQGVRIVSAHNRQRYNVETHRDIVGSYRDANIYTGRINGIYGPGSQVISVFGQLLILGIGGAMYLHHPQEINLGELTAFFLYVNRFFSPIQLLVQQYNTFQQGRASVTKLRGLLETEPSVLEAPDAVELPPIKGEIRFDHVSFGYDPAVPVLHDVDLTIAPGETVAFVGATGAGKSTMAKLVTRFYDPTAGRVLIDGYDLKGVTLASLRSQLGVVPQEPFLFAGTIRDNISFARPGAPDDEVWEAVHQVGLGELVHRLPYGLDTPVHERGQSLSSGERQLIALGRAFMAEPRVLVLDEATSNLDLKSETLVEAALDVLLEGRTAVLIAHRLSTAMRADRIVVVGDGNLLEVGSHAELVALGGHYAEMYDTWINQSHAA
jgi:ATP-binding cassette subfamily B protein